ncbi:MAG TPA: hypothetical protein VGJ74_04290 [Burkholderiales bacterium]|jgi:hypothetical protein
MRYKFSMLQDCLRAELVGRESVDETQEFIRAVAEEARTQRCPRILVWVRRSRPIFKVEQYRISEYFKQLAANREVRVALLGDSEEVRAAHEYIEVLARQQGANVRAFREEPPALEWLKAPVLQSQEKR